MRLVVLAGVDTGEVVGGIGAHTTKLHQNFETDSTARHVVLRYLLEMFAKLVEVLIDNKRDTITTEQRAILLLAEQLIHFVQNLKLGSHVKQLKLAQLKLASEVDTHLNAGFHLRLGTDVRLQLLEEVSRHACLRLLYVDAENRKN